MGGGEAVASADVVVVGGGAAGCVLAARLSEDGDRTVLLLEAGPAPREFDAGLLDARRVPGAAAGHPAVRAYDVWLTPGRPWRAVRGWVLGGSSTVNGGYFAAATERDFADWAEAGNPAWAPEAIAPFVRAVDEGPMSPAPVPVDHPAADALRRAAALHGGGFGAVPSNAAGGVRRNAALAYLTPEVRSRPNLAVVGGSRVRRVLLPQGRATGVTGDAGTFLAGEVVLAAGALETPRILFGSGIGPRGVLEGLGIPVVRHLPAVGAGFGDHPQLVLEWEPAAGLPAPELSWLGGCVRAGGYEILQSLVPLPSLGGGAEQPRGGPLAFLLSDLTPRRTGVVRPLPDGGLRVEYGYLTSAAGRRVLREGVRATAALLDAEPLAALSRRPGVLGLSPAVRADDAALDAWIRERLGTAQHTCGTVPMGPEDAPQRAAVDQFGRVHGLRGLRVADTSILPLPPRRGPAATAVLVGERLARAVRDGL